MSRRPTKYKRCKKCKELVSDPDDCANCANSDPLRITRRSVTDGKRGSPTLDIQEGNDGLWGD